VLWKREPSVRLISESSSIVPPACARNPLVRWYATADPPDVPRVETDLARGGGLSRKVDDFQDTCPIGGTGLRLESPPVVARTSLSSKVRESQEGLRLVAIAVARSDPVTLRTCAPPRLPVPCLRCAISAIALR